MASPRLIVQILVSGAQIFGKALSEAGKQAVKNAKHNPQSALGGDVAGVGHATSGSPTDALTRTHRMTLDEAHLILNLKRGEEMERMLTNYEHLFKQNAPPPPPAKPTAPAARGSKAKAAPTYSHYLHSKVVRARERIEAEAAIAKGDAAGAAAAEAGAAGAAGAATGPVAEAAKAASGPGQSTPGGAGPSMGQTFTPPPPLGSGPPPPS
ncbi:hypothetical protein BDV98DRAFT_546983 [Pterulicium gracile]|uniref:Mitochondrial import inner membrane translocase subunit TIM16 n=1 Tax=Pterulicium gracile TaxID=1884261 RepID=A0A5C3QKE8_9AGAR|nr:hypothetical protein BDV98DRAFT_546983 [Pterula gracilis]